MLTKLLVLQESCLNECWLGDKLRILKYIFGQNNSLVWIKLNTKMGFKHHHHPPGTYQKLFKRGHCVVGG